MFLIRIANFGLQDKRYDITPKTTFEEFHSVMVTDRRTANIDTEVLQIIFQRVQDKAVRRSEEEKHAADRHQRRAIDALRSRIKHLEPPIRVTDTWEQVRPRVEKYEEYKVLETDDLRQAAFDKALRRLREKEEDSGRDRDRSRTSRRDRDHRGSSRRGERSRFSRTPEPDAYEADRRKAQADRERSYKRGLSPIRERREERDRDRDREKDRYRERPRDRERDRHSRALSHYEIERREREEERERLYRTRADPRGSRDELDYGADTRSTVSTSDRRRRLDSDADSVSGRSAKRHRRESPERDRSRGPRRDRDRDVRVEEEKKEERAVHSGSEEGEIEEE